MNDLKTGKFEVPQHLENYYLHLNFSLLNNTTRYCNDDCKVKGEVGGSDDGQEEGGDSVGDGEER